MRWTIFALALALSGAVQAQPQRHAISPKAQGILYPTPIAITSWFTPNDFPREAMNQGEPNIIRFSLKVDAFGMPTSCDIITTSGIALLDSETCRLALLRARFNPIIDANGTPIASTYSSAVRWENPMAWAPVPAKK